MDLAWCRRSLAYALPLLALASVGHTQDMTFSGTVVSRDFKNDPVHRALLRIAGPGGELWLDSAVTDTAGHFQLTVPFQPGCYRLQARALGHGYTERTFAVSDTGTRTLGLIPLRAPPLDEWPALLLFGCPYPGAGASPWGTDTVRVAP